MMLTLRSAALTTTRIANRPFQIVARGPACRNIISPFASRAYATPAKPKKGSIGAEAKRGRTAKSTAAKTKPRATSIGQKNTTSTKSTSEKTPATKSSAPTPEARAAEKAAKLALKSANLVKAAAKRKQDAEQRKKVAAAKRTREAEKRKKATVAKQAAAVKAREKVEKLKATTLKEREKSKARKTVQAEKLKATKLKAATLKKNQAQKKKAASSKASAKSTADEIKLLKEQALNPPPAYMTTGAWLPFLHATFKNSTPGDSRDSVAQAKQASADFKRLTDSEKESYSRIAREQDVERRQAYKAWVEQHSPEDIRIANAARTTLRKRIKTGSLRSGVRFAPIKDDRALKAPVNPFLRFSVEYTKTSNDSVSAHVRAAEVAKLWKEMSASEKQPYQAAYEAAKGQYVKDYEHVYGHTPSAASPTKTVPNGVAEV